MRVEFIKMSGAGNDFVVIDNRRHRLKDAGKLAKRLCDRRWGIGADGLLLLEPSRKADYRMMYYNADGSYGGMCGNGGRCIAKYATFQHIAPRFHEFEALSHIYHVHVGSDTVSLRMKEPRDIKLNVSIRVGSQRFVGHYVDTGAPHLVVFGSFRNFHPSRLDQVNVAEIGRKIRYHRMFAPNGTNVNFVESGAHACEFRMRTYERGVEAETLACGTGSVAVGIVSALVLGAASPVRIIPPSQKKLLVSFRRAGDKFHDVHLEGPAEFTFSGTVNV